MRHATLAERLWAVLNEEHEGYRCTAIDRCHTVLNGRGTEREMDLLDWGMVYGIAHGILLAERGAGADPVELARDAHAAAHETYRLWGGDITPRKSISPLLDSLVAAFEEAEGPIEMAAHGIYDMTDDAAHVKRLTRQLCELRELIGTPEPA